MNSRDIQIRRIKGGFILTYKYETETEYRDKVVIDRDEVLDFVGKFYSPPKKEGE